MQIGGDHSWFLYPTKHIQILTLLMLYRAEIDFPVYIVYCNFNTNRSKMYVVTSFGLLLLRMRFIGTCSEVILFPSGN